MNSDTCQNCGKRRDQHRSTDKACPLGPMRHGTYWQFSMIDAFSSPAREATCAVPADRFPPKKLPQ